MSPRPFDPSTLFRRFLAIVRLAGGLLAVHGLLLAMTFLVVPADRGDLLVQFAWTLFLVPGWYLSTLWTAAHASLATRYAHAVITSIGLHAWLAAAGTVAGVGFHGYYAGFAAISVVAIAVAGVRWTTPPIAWQIRLPRQDVWVWLAVMLLVVCVYRQPRSNDIVQFVAQQQDMAVGRSLQPSRVGMNTFGIDQTMPRWRSHLWHLVPSLIADLTSLSVEGVLRRWLPIPLAFSTLATLLYIVGCLAGRRVALWMAAFAVFGPVLMWFRSYNAFNYSFRLTNSFVIDKDISLFLLVPAFVYVSARWMRRSPRAAMPLLLLIPAVVKFHPMNAVYLVLLVPFTVLGYGSRNATGRTFPLRNATSPLAAVVQSWQSNRRGIAWSLLVALLFVAVLMIGDAQTAHQQIEAITRIDHRDHQTGRRLHYWIGQYATVPNHGFALDTTVWSQDRLSLRARVLLNCDLLGAFHVAFLVWLYTACRRHGRWIRHRCLALATVMILLWGLWLASAFFLGRWPHLLAGYERLHWFAYLPALVAVAGSVGLLLAPSHIDNRSRSQLPATLKGFGCRQLSQCGAFLTVLVLVYSAIVFRMQRQSLFAAVPYLNCLLDFEVGNALRDSPHARRFEVDGGLVSPPPGYIRPSDRVLFLGRRGDAPYWAMKQGVFWSELYAEGYAWRLLGDSFLQDREMYYRLQDRMPVDEISRWLQERRVTILYDPRPGADQYFADLNQAPNVRLTRLASGVWRVERAID